MKMPMTCASFALILTVAGLTGCANSTPGSYSSASTDASFRPPMDRRETIMATGYAVIGVQNNKNAPQQRLLAIRAAKIDAYRGLAEQVYGLNLDANTTVSEMTVMNDTFRTRVEGVIFGAKLTSITPLNNDTYEVTMSLDRGTVNDLRLLYLEQVAGNRR
jgi:hypothetical protein